MSETKSPAKQAKERRERFTTASGLPLERLYSEESLAGWDAGSWSLMGAPAIVVPSGLGPSRLPLGLQLVATPGDDRRLLAAAAWCEATLPPIGAPPL